MDNNGKKKNLGIIIIAIIIILLLIFLLWFFLLRGDKKNSDNNTSTNDIEDVNTNTTPDTPTPEPTSEYDYTEGVLTQIVDQHGYPKVTDYIINGIILVGNRHSYAGLEAESEGIIEKLAAQGYKKEGINSSFYLNEWIELYIDTDYNGAENAVRIFITPHRTVEELETMSISKIKELAENNGGYVIDYVHPDADNYKYVGNGYVNMDYPEGKYDILFTYKGKLAYYINIDLKKEPTE